MSTDSASTRQAWRVKDFCEAYSVSASTINRMIENGSLKSIKIFGRRLIPQTAIDEILLKAAEESAARVASNLEKYGP